MKTLDLFVVELENTINDTIKTSSGLELYVDNRFNEFEHRVTEGPVVCAPSKYNTGVKKGDTLYFHHLVVVNEGQALTGCDNHYLIKYNDKHTINNQAIGYKCKDTERLDLWRDGLFLKPVDQKAEVVSEIIEVVSTDDQKLPTRAEVAFDAPWLEDLGVKKGDVVGFKNRDYRITIDGQEYYRTRAEDLMYVIE